MLTGLPPFQANDQASIFSKAKSGDYSWPGINKRCHNYIPKLAKDLVMKCLAFDPETRPDCDAIVDHAFFQMYQGCIAAEITADCKVRKPTWLMDEKDPAGDKILPTAGMTNRAQEKFFVDCGIGRTTAGRRRLPVGYAIDKTGYQECVEEQAAGCGPVVPLDFNGFYSNYTPAAKIAALPAQQARRVLSNAPRRSARLASSNQDVPDSMLSKTKPQQMKEVPSSTLEKQASVAKKASYGTQLRGKTRAVPLRKEQTQGEEERIRQIKPAQPKTQDMSQRERPKPAITSNAQKKEQIVILGKEDQVAGAEPLPRKNTVRNVEIRPTETVTRKRKDSGYEEAARKKFKLIDPNEEHININGSTEPDAMKKLKVLHDQITFTERPSNYDMSLEHHQLKDAPDTPFVEQWVDYTTRHGLGYLLSDGSLGAALNNSTGVIVRNAKAHLLKRKFDLEYTERTQLVSRNGEAVEFYEHHGDVGGLKRTKLSPKSLQVTDGSLPTSSNEYYQEKLTAIEIWHKFAKHMAKNLCAEDAANMSSTNEIKPAAAAIPPETTSTVAATATAPKNEASADPFLNFYDRIDSVGIFGFLDGAYQFNFPDHTKLVLSGDGKVLDYYHLQPQDADAYHATKEVVYKHLERRKHLRHTTTAVRFRYMCLKREKMALDANRFDEKLEWIRDVFEGWLEMGKLGGRRPS